MNKSELIEAVAKVTKASKAATAEAIDATFEVIVKAVAKGDKVTLVGVGTFEAKKRAASEGRNPRTGAKIKIPASIQPKFKAGKGFKDKVNKKK